MCRNQMQMRVEEGKLTKLKKIDTANGDLYQSRASVDIDGDGVHW